MMFSYSTGKGAKTAATLMVATTAVMAIGAFASVYAQDDTQNEIDERLLACADISDTAERTACFDDVVKGLKQGAESSEAVDAVTTAAPVPAPAESRSEVSAPVAAGAAATSIPAASAGATATESSNASPPADSKDAGSAEASPDSAVDEFGLEDQIAQADKEEKKQKESEAGSVNAMIVRSSKSGDFHFVVELDNGQVWEETDGSRRIGLPRVGMPVEVYKRRFGGYRMKIGDDNRVAWVRRLK